MQGDSLSSGESEPHPQARVWIADDLCLRWGRWSRPVASFGGGTPHCGGHSRSPARAFEVFKLASGYVQCLCTPMP